MATFKEFYKKFGLNEFPFNTFTTELETEIAQYLFVSQGNYDPIVDSFNAQRSIILRGERGSGKTAILADFKRNLNKKKTVSATLTDYSELEINYTNQDFYFIIVRELVEKLFEQIGSRPLLLRKIGKDKRIFLSYLIHEYLPQFSVNQIKDKITKIQLPPWTRATVWCYNKFRGTLNYSGTVFKNIAVEYIIKHFSLIPPISDENEVTEFFPELKMNVEREFFDQKISFRILQKLCELIKELGFRKPIVFLDKIDEDNRFENDAEAISNFILTPLSDANILGSTDLQTVFFTWSTPFRFIEDKIRTQKYYCPILKWDKDDLETALNRRFSHFSKNKIKDYKTIFEKEVSGEDINRIFELSNSNPRDLWHLFKTIFQQQHSTDKNSSKISKEAIFNSLGEFVTNFNYYEYYPRKSNARANSMDVYSYYNHLSKLEEKEFTKSKLNTVANIGGSINNYVIGMERIGLIERKRQEKGAVIYAIKDPKLVYAMKNNLELRKK